MGNTLFLRPLAGVGISLKGSRHQLQTELDTEMLKWLQLLLCLYLAIFEATQELESQPNEQDILENTSPGQSLYETTTKQRRCASFYWIWMRACREPPEMENGQNDTKLLARLKRSLNTSCSHCHMDQILNRWICSRVCQEPEEEKQDDQTDTKLLARLKRSLNASCSDCHNVDQKEDSKLLTRLKRDVELTKEAASTSVMKLFFRLGHDQGDDDITKNRDTDGASSHDKIRWRQFY